MAKKYHIACNWKSDILGKCYFHTFYCTNWLVFALFIFAVLRLKYSTISLDCRRR